MKKTDKNKISKKSVIFVCTGNTCRSPMAEYILKDVLKKRGKLSAFNVKSAGLAAETGSDMSPNAKLALEKLGIKPRKHTAKQLTERAVKSAYIIICMTERHKQAINSPVCKTVAEICGGVDVPDPYGGSLEIYIKTAEYLRYASDDIADLLEKENFTK